MDIIELKCRNCGATLNKKSDNDYFCEHCGTQYVFEDNDTSYEIEFGRLKRIRTDKLDVKIPYGVIVIEKDVFRNNKYINSVQLPKTVVEIEAEAFLNCENLKKIDFPLTLNTIGDRAFKNSGIEELSLPQCLNRLGEEAFMECKNLSKVFLPENFKFKLVKTFKKCSKLKEVICDLTNFFPSFSACELTNNNKFNQPTFFDAFQGTEYYDALYDKCIKNKTCLYCESTLKKRFLTNVYKCTRCKKIYTGKIFR